MSNNDSNHQNTDGAPAPAVWPAFQARDAAGLIEFLVQAFGFVKVVAYEDDGQIAHAQLSWPEGGGIMLGTYKPDGEWSREPGTAGTYVVTDHVDEIHARAKAAGATILREPVDQDYGSREVMVQDPEGNLWSFGTYRGEPLASS